ncbi:MAG: nucleotidyltransferase domain-containing protein, partial [Candidatus Gracilibacteria bacterium]
MQKLKANIIKVLTMNIKIKKILETIEKENNVKILFAVENGSRAWRMESKDSDYDVRFVFAYSVNEYIKINKPVEVINGFYDKNGLKCDAKEALIDVSGFDIFKYMKLLADSNPTTIEWLMSDIVYYGEQNKVLKDFILDNFSPKTLFYHYKSLGRTNYYDFIKRNNKVTHKKYLYVFRGLINALCVYNNNTIPPINFLEAVENSKEIMEKTVYLKLQEIIKLKSQGKEKDDISNIDIFDNYIEDFLANNYEKPSKN